MTDTRKMTEGNPLKLIFLFSLPLMFGNVFQQLYTVADTAIVGKGVGVNGLAALGAVDWLCWMFLAVAQGFTSGFGVRMSQKFGQGDPAGLRKTLALSARFSIYIAFFGLLIGELGAPLFLRWLHVSAEIWPYSELYLRIVFAGFPAVTFYNYCAASLRSVGNSRTPLIAMVTAALTNIALDCITVFVLGWGIAGAAGATVFSQCISGVICAAKMKKMPEMRFARADCKREGRIMGELARLGTPIALANVIIAVGGLAIIRVVNGFSLGFIAGFAATNKLFGILEIAALSYGYGITTYVGQNYGAGLYERIRRGMRAALLLSLVTAVVVGAVMILCGRSITMLFISREEAVLAAVAGETAYRYLFIMSVFLPILYLIYVFSSAVRGMGYSIVSTCSSVMETIIRLSVAFAVAASGWENGTLLAEPAAWFGGATMMGIAYLIIIRKKIREIK